MKEYFNLLNMVDEGVIVLSNKNYNHHSNHSDEEQRIRFCSRQALKILKPDQ